MSSKCPENENLYSKPINNDYSNCIPCVIIVFSYFLNTFLCIYALAYTIKEKKGDKVYKSDLPTII